MELRDGKSQGKLNFEILEARGRTAGRIEGRSTAIIPCLLTAKVHDTWAPRQDEEEVEQ